MGLKLWALTRRKQMGWITALFIQKNAPQRGACLPTANAIALEQDGKTFQDGVKDAVVEKVMEGD